MIKICSNTISFLLKVANFHRNLPMVTIAPLLSDFVFTGKYNLKKLEFLIT